MNPTIPDGERIVMIAPHFEEYCLLLANALARNAPVMLVIDATRLDDAFAGRTMPLADRLTLAHVDFRRPGTILRILRLMRRFRPTVLHVQEPSGFAKAVIGAAVVTAAKPFCRIALTVHDPEPHEGRDSDIAQKFARFRRYIRSRADVVFVHGAFCRRDYLRSHAYPGQRVAATAHGAILEGRHRTRPVAGHLNILFFGRMERYKGLDTLYGATKIMAGKDVDFKLTVAGSGPELDAYQPRLETMPQVAVDNRFVPSVELIGQIEQAHCVVLPYSAATQSGVLAGALANGKPVVASGVGGIPDIVEDGVDGILVPPEDPHALADALTTVAQDEALLQRLTQGAHASADKLDWDPIADQLMRDYRAPGEPAAVPAPSPAALDVRQAAATHHAVKVTIGIKALNEEARIAGALASAVAAAGPLGGEVILADSGSTDRTIEIAREFPVRVLQLRNRAERSCGAGAQLAFQQARGEYFYILDGDMELHSGFLEAGIAYLEANPEVAAVGGIVNERNLDGEEFQIRANSVTLGHNWLPGLVDRLDCGGLYRTSALRDLGYFSDRNLHAFEEFDVGARLASRGWKLARINVPAVDHFGHTAGGYHLLWRRIRSGYSGAPGEVLRAALGRSHLPIVLSRLGHVRYGIAIICWWIMLVAAGFSAHRFLLWAALVGLPLGFLMLRRRSVRLGLYSFAAWNVSALGLLTGLFRRRISPDQPLATVDLTAAHAS